MPRRLRRPGFWIALVCLLPLLRLIGLGAGGGLGANPIEFVTHSTGTWTLVGLLVTLSFTPARRLTGATPSSATGACSASSASYTPACTS